MFLLILRRILMCRSKGGNPEVKIMPKGKVLWQFVQKRECRKHRSEKSNDLGGQFKCMRCGKGIKHATIIGTCWEGGSGGWAKQLTTKLRKWGRRHNGKHDLQRTVDTNGKMLVWGSEMLWLYQREAGGGNRGIVATLVLVRRSKSC